MFTIAIIGRPNVGKSTLFNSMIGKSMAIVDDRPGVTRDWRDAHTTIMGHKVRVIDTAGLEDARDDSIPARMRAQTDQAIEQADVLVFVYDGREGVTPVDEHFAALLRCVKQPVILAANKGENERRIATGLAEGNALGLGQPIPISAAHGHGLYDVYEHIVSLIPEEDKASTDDDGQNSNRDFVDFDALEGDMDYAFQDDHEVSADKPIKIAIAGRPNVGKSTLVNALLGENRVMTGPEAGLTRDAIATGWEWQGTAMTLVDTAGLRKKARITDKLEKRAVDDSLRAIRLAQIVIIVIDSVQGLDKQDVVLAAHAIEEGRALIIAFNKWDAVSEHAEILDEMRYRLEKTLGQIRNLPHVTISALNGRNLNGLMQCVMDTYKLWDSRVSTSPLNRWLADVTSRHPAPLVNGGRSNKMRYMTQVKARPPTFALWCSYPQHIPDSYKRYLVHNLRESFDMEGVPVRLMYKTTKNPFKGKAKK